VFGWGFHAAAKVKVRHVCGTKSHCTSTDGRTKKTMEVIEHKSWYYKTALDAGTEDIHKNRKYKSLLQPINPLCQKQKGIPL
jgi:hypothetical protein